MRIKWSIPDFVALRHEPGVAADIDSRAARVAAAAGDRCSGGLHEPEPRQVGR